jgi:hypothetical protein
MKHNLRSRKSRHKICKMDITYNEPCTSEILMLSAPLNYWVLFEQKYKFTKLDDSVIIQQMF